jgi:hypothetical protein
MAFVVFTAPDRRREAPTYSEMDLASKGND